MSGVDATNIYPDGHVRYKLLMGFRSTESTSADEFTKDVQRSLQQNDQTGNVRVVGKGSRVTIVKTKPEKEEVELELRDSGGSKHKIRLKFKDSNYGYSADDLKRLLAVGFAETEAEAKSEGATASIQLGMTPEQVIAIRGSPKTRVDLGSKIVLTYDDLKLIFEKGKLADVQ